MSGKKVAVTGATGFLGHHIIPALINAGYIPVAIVRNRVTAQKILLENIEMREADILNEEALTAAFDGMDMAIHLAGKVSVNTCDNEEIDRVNITGTQNFLHAVKQAHLTRAIFTSTTSALAALTQNYPDQAFDETAAFNLSAEPVAYIQAKRRAHELALAAQETGLPVIILSPSFILGPDDINNNTSALIDAVRRKKLPICPHGGVNPIDVRDLAQAYVAALAHPDPEGHYILASRENMTLKDFIGRVACLAKVKPPRISLPNTLILLVAGLVEFIHPRGALTSAGARLGNLYWYFDAALARHDFSLTCRPLNDTLQDTLNWLMTRDKLE